MNLPNILVINLALRPESPVKIFPVGLSYIVSSLKRSGYDLELFDIDLNRYDNGTILSKISERTWDIVMLGCIVTGYRIVKPLLHEIKRANPNALVVVGNSVASSIPQTLLSKTQADIAVISEGDKTVLDIVRAWQAGTGYESVPGIWVKTQSRIVKTPERQPIADINTIEPPLYDLFDVESYIAAHRNLVGHPLPRPREEIRAFPVNTSRGCINQCTFCYHCFIGLKYRYRSPSNIVNELIDLKQRYSINYAFLWDDLTFFSKKQLLEFTNLMLENRLDINWVGTVRGNLFRDEADLGLLAKVKEAGCIRLGYALESASQDILKAMRKNVSLDDFRRQKKLMDRAGIPSGTSIVLGYPQETPETIGMTYKFCLDLELYPSTGYLLPQPGTPIYELAKQSGHIQDEEEYLFLLGDRQDLRINLTSMSNETFEETVKYWLLKLNRELKLNLNEDQLVKTQFKRAKQNDEIVTH